MPFILIAIGLLLVVVGIRNTYAQLGSLVVSDFTGPGNFFYWIVALFIIGAIGYVDALKEASDLMLALVILALILSNRGFFQKFQSSLGQGSAQAPSPGPPVPSPTSGGGGSGGSSSGSASTSGGSAINTNTLVTAGMAAMAFL